MCSETVTGETQVELEKKHQHHHYHRHSHKHKHKHKHKDKRKDCKRSNVKHDKSKLSRDANHLNNDLDQSWSKHPSIDSSESGSHPVEVIVVSSDTSASPVSSTVQNGSTRNDVTKLQRRKSRSRSRSQYESRSVIQERELPKETGVCERAQAIQKRAHEIVRVRWENMQCMMAVDRVPLQVHGRDV